MTFTELKEKLSSFEMPLSYFVVDRTMTSLVCFHNFYDQVLRVDGLEVDLYLSLFDENGKELVTHVKRVSAKESIQIDLGELVDSAEGLVGVMAVPCKDLRSVIAENVVLRDEISTGYYMMWKSRSSEHVDMSHEWLPARTKASGLQEHYIAFAPVSIKIKRGLILMNTYCGSEHVTGNLEIAVFDRNLKQLGKLTQDALNPLGIRKVHLEDVFPEFNAWLEKGHLTVMVKGPDVALPMSIERHPLGDFHIHHA